MASNNEVKESKNEIDVQRGERVKLLRNMAGLASVDLAKIAGVSRATISYWENASTVALSEQGAVKLISVFQKLGINCNFTWLWTGDGDKPSFADKKLEDPLLPSIEKEILFFKKLNENSVIHKITSTAYWPFFDLNELVGGIWQPIDSLRSACFAIITVDQKNELKWLAPLNLAKKKHYVQINNLPSDDSSEQIKLDVFAPIIRTWRLQ